MLCRSYFSFISRENRIFKDLEELNSLDLQHYGALYRSLCRLNPDWSKSHDWLDRDEHFDTKHSIFFLKLRYQHFAMRVMLCWQFRQVLYKQWQGMSKTNLHTYFLRCFNNIIQYPWWLNSAKKYENVNHEFTTLWEDAKQNL